METEKKKDIKKYLHKNFSVKKAMEHFMKSLQNVADSSMSFYGFDKVPIKYGWDTENPDLAWINNEYCYINLDCSLSHELEFNDRKKITTGKVVHEVFGHWLHTDFQRQKELIDSGDEFPFDRYFRQSDNYEDIKTKYMALPELFQEIFWNVANIVEDPVVEYLALKKYPGFGSYIDFMLQYLRKELNKNATKIDVDSLNSGDLINLVLCKARNCLPEQFANISEIKQIDCFDDLSLMPNYADRLFATAKIISTIWNYLSEDFENAEKMNELLQKMKQLFEDSMDHSSNNEQRTQNGQANQQGNSQNNSGTGTQSVSFSNDLRDDNETGNEQGNNKSSQGLNDEDNINNDCSSSSANTNQNEGEVKKDEDREQNNKNAEETDNDKGDLQDNSDNNYYNGDESNNPDADDLSDNGLNHDQEMSKIYNELDSLVNETSKQCIDKAFADCDKDAVQKEMESFDIREYVRNGFENTSTVVIRKQFETCLDTYRNVFTPEKKRIAKTLANSVSKILKDKRKRKILYGVDDGSIFDILSYSNGSEKPFMDIKRPDKRPICSVGVMVDMSTSMNGERIKSALDTALVLEAFCNQLKIPFFGYGHWYNYGQTNIQNFIDFENTSVKDISRLCNMLDTNGCNHDGMALRYGLSKLAKRRENQKFLFVISDGRPNAEGYGTGQMKKDIIDIYKKAKKDNILIIPIAISDDIEILNNIYGNCVVDGRSLNKLPKTITGILLKEIKKLI